MDGLRDRSRLLRELVTALGVRPDLPVADLPWEQLVDQVWPRRPVLLQHFAVALFPEDMRVPSPDVVGAALLVADLTADHVTQYPGGLPPQGLTVLGRLALDVCFTAALADWGRVGWCAYVRPAPVARFLGWAWAASSEDEAESLAVFLEVYLTILVAHREWALFQDAVAAILLWDQLEPAVPSSPFPDASRQLHEWI